MFIVIEGVDGTGKTTLANELHERLRVAGADKIARVHCGPPKRHPLDEYELDLQWYKPGGGWHVIADRLHWGELIYGPLYRDGSQLGKAGLLHVELFLQSKGALTVYLEQSNDELLRRLEQRGEDYLKHDDLPRVAREYDRLAADLEPVTFCDPGEGEEAEILMLAELAERAAAPLAQFTSYIGPPRPDTLLLGDRRGPKAPQAGALHNACFAPYSGVSGRYLLQALWDAHWRNGFGIANACEEDVEALWQELDRPHVIALGGEAETQVNRYGIPHSSVPHPQTIRRIHHYRQLDYGELLSRAALGYVEALSWPK